MRKNLNLFITAVSLSVALASPLRLAGQEPKEEKKEHHHYKLIDLGTLGGPTSFLNGGGSPNFPASKILNRSGEAIAFGDTSTPDPFGPSWCYESDCYGGSTFTWSQGKQTNLGVLPQNPAKGSQSACLDCAWSSFPLAISDTGLVVGESETNDIDPLTAAPASLAVLWKDGKIINLGTLGGNESTAADVNNRGDVVGVALDSTGDPVPGRWPYAWYVIFGNGTEAHAFLWHEGKMHDLGTLGGHDSAAFFINEAGMVAGASDVDTNSNLLQLENPGGPTVHPFLWHNGKMRDLIADAPSGMFGGSYGIATWLNQEGQVTGTMNLTGDTTWHSFLWDRGSVKDLGTLGGFNTASSSMNNSGHIVGRSDVSTICTACPANNQKQLHHPFLYRDGAIIDLGVLPGDTAGTAVSVNDEDQAVGQTTPCAHIRSDDGCDSPHYHAVLWEHGSAVDLQTLLIPGSNFTVSEPVMINNRGEILGLGQLPNGNQHALLLVPRDE